MTLEMRLRTDLLLRGPWRLELKGEGLRPFDVESLSWRIRRVWQQYRESIGK